MLLRKVQTNSNRCSSSIFSFCTPKINIPLVMTAVNRNTPQRNPCNPALPPAHKRWREAKHFGFYHIFAALSTQRKRMDVKEWKKRSKGTEISKKKNTFTQDISLWLYIAAKPLSMPLCFSHTDIHPDITFSRLLNYKNMKYCGTTSYSLISYNFWDQNISFFDGVDLFLKETSAILSSSGRAF